MFAFWIFAPVACAAAGGLVKKILETKKEYEVSPSSSSKSKVQVRAVVAAGLITTRGQYCPSQPSGHSERCASQGQVFQTALAAALLIIGGRVRGEKKISKQMEQKGVIVLTLRPQKCCPPVEPEGLITRAASRAANRPHRFDTTHQDVWSCSVLEVS